MLIAKDIQELESTLDCWEVDYSQIEKLLKYAGKGEHGEYEHFYLTMALYHLNEALNYGMKIVANGEELVEKSRAVNGLTCAYTDNVQRSDASTQKFNPRVIEDSQKKTEQMAEIAQLIDEVFDEHPDRAAEAGVKPGAIGFLTGHVLYKMGGKGNPLWVQEKIGERIAAA